MSCLCAVAVWWSMKCEYLPTNYGLLLIIPTIFFTIYVLILQYLLKKGKGLSFHKASYNETVNEMAEQGMTFDYFNCNPIFCLRKKWLGINEPSGRQRIVPYVTGKYYLQHLPHTGKSKNEETSEEKKDQHGPESK